MLHYIEVRKLYLLICGHYTIHRLGLLGIKTTPTRNRLHHLYKETLKLEAFSVVMSFEFDNEIKKVEDSKEKLWDGQKK